MSHTPGSRSSTPTGSVRGGGPRELETALEAAHPGRGEAVLDIPEGDSLLEWLRPDNYNLRLQLLRLKYGHRAVLQLEQ